MGSLPTYLRPFDEFVVDEAIDDEDDVDEFDGSGMLVVVVEEADDGGVMVRPFVDVVAVVEWWCCW